MTCAVIVFYLIGYHTESSKHPPIQTTLVEATVMIKDPAYIAIWEALGVYPEIHPCA